MRIVLFKLHMVHADAMTPTGWIPLLPPRLPSHGQSASALSAGRKGGCRSTCRHDSHSPGHVAAVLTVFAAASQSRERGREAPATDESRLCEKCHRAPAGDPGGIRAGVQGTLHLDCSVAY